MMEGTLGAALLLSDGGNTWGSAATVDSRRPEDVLESIIPGSIKTGTSGETYHRYWLAGHDDVICSIYGQIRSEGEPWPDPVEQFEGLDECPQSFHLLNDPDGNLIILFDTGPAVYLSSFDGESWSEPENQSSLVEFRDPETFLPVELGCMTPSVVEVDAPGIDYGIVVVGCDDGDGADIWVRVLSIPEAGEFTGEEDASNWSPIDLISELNQNSKNPIIVPDADGFLHAFWGTDSPDGEDQTGLFYSRWDGLRWSQPSMVLSSPSGFSADEFDIRVDVLGRLAATWGSEQPGEIYFSQAATSRAALMSEWLSPVSLPVSSPFATDPQLEVDSFNAYYVAYTIPINEKRGVYLVMSSDGGPSWSEPVTVFDGVEAGWQAVGQPRIAVGTDGTIHILWTKRTLPPADQPSSLHYSSSVDGGLTWSEPEEVSSQPAAASKIIALGDRVVHILWRDENGTTWHQISTDHGESWTRPLRVEGQSSSGPMEVVVDGAGQLHLLSMSDSLGFSTDEEENISYLKHWTWSGDRWNSGEMLEIADGDIERGISGAIGSGGDLTVIFASETIGDNEQDLMRGMSFSTQQLDIPRTVPTPLPQITPTATPIPEATATPEPTPTARAVFSPDENSGSQLPIPVDSSSPLSSSLLGIIPAGLVVLIVFFVGIRVLRRDRH
jgi:hypothetical protein